MTSPFPIRGATGRSPSADQGHFPLKNRKLPPAPIAFFVYNRPHHTEDSLDALAKNSLARESPLWIFSDAPRNSNDEGLVQRVRKVIRSSRGFRSVSIVERQRNLGLARSIVQGVSEILESNDRVIVLEDDLITSPHFLRYMNDALDRYEHTEEVISIHGYVYPTRTPLPETFFLRGADCWGWGTWQRGWQLFRNDAPRLLGELKKRGLTQAFDFDGAYPYSRMLKRRAADHIDSWAICWYASAFLENKLTLYPGRSLVNHIGVDSKATHAAGAKWYLTELSPTPVAIMPIPIEENQAARKAFEAFFRRTRGSIFSRITQRFIEWSSRITKTVFP